MNNYLSENEILSLNFLKDEYFDQKQNPLSYIDSKFSIKITEDTISSLQEKGYIKVKKNDLGSRLHICSITLTDKFFAYFNISL